MLTRILSVSTPCGLYGGNVLPERLAFATATWSVGATHPTFPFHINFQTWEF